MKSVEKNSHIAVREKMARLWRDCRLHRSQSVAVGEPAVPADITAAAAGSTVGRSAAWLPEAASAKLSFMVSRNFQWLLEISIGCYMTYELSLAS